MNLEIERKFLVKSSHFRDESVSSSVIRQGYLASDENGSVRVIVGGSKGFITAKGATNESGSTIS